MIKFHPSLKFILIPFAYIQLVKNLKKFYLENELRFLYKDILVPWQKRIDDHQCSDLRDIRQELVNDQKESIVQKQIRLVENRGYGKKEAQTKKQESNMNLVKR